MSTGSYQRGKVKINFEKIRRKNTTQEKRKVRSEWTWRVNEFPTLYLKYMKGGNYKW